MPGPTWGSWELFRIPQAATMQNKSNTSNNESSSKDSINNINNRTQNNSNNRRVVTVAIMIMAARQGKPEALQF